VPVNVLEKKDRREKITNMNLYGCRVMLENGNRKGQGAQGVTTALLKNMVCTLIHEKHAKWGQKVLRSKDV
jgi:hypothetical protein